jgi:hypothetical protein
MSTSSGRIVESMCRGSASTATVIVLVCVRPRFSVGGTRCHLCPPVSPANSAAAPRPEMQSTAMPGRFSTRSTLKRPPRAKAQVDLHLIEHEELGISAALGSSNLDDDGIG